MSLAIDPTTNVARFYSSWTEERVELLKQLAAQDLSCAQIAAQIGGITRNAVIGKLGRLGLAPGRAIGVRRLRDGIPTRKAPRPRAQRREGLNFAKIDRKQEMGLNREDREQRAAESRLKFCAVEVVDLPAEQSAFAVPLAKLNAHTCRWPLGDPRDLEAMRFCGAEPHAAYPYCARHCRVAYRLPSRGGR